MSIHSFQVTWGFYFLKNLSVVECSQKCNQVIIRFEIRLHEILVKCHLISKVFLKCFW